MEDNETKKENPKEDKPETPANDTGKGDKYETTPVIERARQEREKLDAANLKKEELLDREEKIIVRKELGGVTEAGKSPEKKEYSEEEKASRARIKKIGDASGSAWAKNYE